MLSTTQPTHLPIPNTPAQRISAKPPSPRNAKENTNIAPKDISLFICTTPKCYLYTANAVHIQVAPPPTTTTPAPQKKADCSCTHIYHPSFDSIEPFHQLHLNSLQSLLLIQPILSSGAILCPPAITNSISIALLNHTLQNQSQLIPFAIPSPNK